MNRILVILLAAGTVSLNAAERRAPFGADESVVFLGDSITAGCSYLFNLQLYQTLRMPAGNTRIWNAGFSGEAAGGGIARLDRDVFAHKPTQVFAMFGMNDVDRNAYASGEDAEKMKPRREKAIAHYKEKMGELTDKLLASGAKVTLMTPTAFDEYTDLSKSDRMPGCNEQGLTACAKVVRELAAKKGCVVAELHRPTTELFRRKLESAYLCTDRVHPSDAAGHLYLTGLLLDALGVSPLVDETSIDAKGRTDFSFSYAPKALPFPVRSGYRSVEKFYPFTERHNREILKVTGLTEGTYELSSGGRTFATFSAAELARGVNIATNETPGQLKVMELAKKIYRARMLRGQLMACRMPEKFAISYGGNPDDFASMSAALDRWIAKETERKSVWLDTFKNKVECYRLYMPKRMEIEAEIEGLLKEIAAESKPVRCEIRVKRTAAAG